MNSLSIESKNYILNQYDINIEMLDIIEDTFKDLNIEDFEYYNLILEVVSEYQSYNINRELDSDLAEPYNNLKDIIIKVLNYKLKGITEENTRYESEIKYLVLNLNDNSH